MEARAATVGVERTTPHRRVRLGEMCIGLEQQVLQWRRKKQMVQQQQQQLTGVLESLTSTQVQVLLQQQ